MDVKDELELNKTQEEIFLMYSQAMFMAQHLEQGIKFALEAIGIVAPSLKSQLLEESAFPAVGKLFDELRKKEYLSDSDQKEIKEALKLRNYLAHEFWAEDNIIKIFEGKNKDRKKLLETLRAQTYVVARAGKILECIVAQHLSNVDDAELRYYAEVISLADEAVKGGSVQ